MVKVATGNTAVRIVNITVDKEEGTKDIATIIVLDTVVADIAICNDVYLLTSATTHATRQTNDTNKTYITMPTATATTIRAAAAAIR